MLFVKRLIRGQVLGLMACENLKISRGSQPLLARLSLGTFSKLNLPLYVWINVWILLFFSRFAQEHLNTRLL